MATSTRLTIDDFERLPQEIAEGHELVDGELVEVPGNNPEHNLTRDFLNEVARPFVREHNLGMVLSEQEYDFGGNAHAPDITFFGREKVPLLERKRRVQKFVPDLAIEIVSPSDTFDSVARKKDRYRRCGTAEVWIISPAAREVLVYSDSGDRIVRGDRELSTPLIPGLQIALFQLFEAYN
ncbi:MAG TPA: Uma2 family endonuclease [Bryobacteraceae bacterium]|nr:Uma2 family endonuclease [Bryobacteraceae bacterium]